MPFAPPPLSTTATFFLPEAEDPGQLRDRLSAVHYRSFFGEPGHRDYLGALLASGISRDRLGDILISGSDAWVFCLERAGEILCGELHRVRRTEVTAAEDPDCLDCFNRFHCARGCPDVCPSFLHFFSLLPDEPCPMCHGQLSHHDSRGDNTLFSHHYFSFAHVSGS